MVGKVPEVFKPHIEKIRALEFTNACPYMWNEPVTRAQMAKFLVKLAESTGIQPIKRTGCTPRDVGDELGDLKEFITTLTQYGYNEGGKTKGITNACEKYRPNDSVTRGEMARFLYRLLYKTQPVFLQHRRIRKQSLKGMKQSLKEKKLITAEKLPKIKPLLLKPLG